MNNPIRRSLLSRASLLATILLLLAAALAQADDRIVGGQEATPGEWPWQVALVQHDGDTYNGQFCGGSLISRDWVLTAAHCVDTAAPGDQDVVAGIHDLQTPDQDYVRVGVVQVIVHPGWNNATKDNDLALLKLASPVDERPANGATLPIAHVDLVPQNIGALTGELVTVTGWGNRDPNGQDYPARLHEVDVPVISNTDCNADYGGSITDNMLCAGYDQGGKDSCQGDSGGPLVYDNAGTWQQAGIVSFGIGCAQAEYPGVYTRVSRYLGWIAENTNPVAATNYSYIPYVSFVPPAPPPNPLENGDFEEGPGVGWAESSALGYPLVVDSFADNDVEPHSGSWAAWLGGDNNETSILTQAVTVPTGQSVLSYYHIIGSADVCGYDFASVEVNGASVSDYTLCEANETGDWVRVTINLGAYAGQAVTLSFIVTTDESSNSNLFVDDVSFVTSATTGAGAGGNRAPINADAPKPGR